MLRDCPQAELASISNALNGGYTAPSPGGDPIVNPNTLPTGRNLFAINAEETPTEDAWEKGVALAKATIADYQKAHKGECAQSELHAVVGRVHTDGRVPSHRCSICSASNPCATVTDV